MWMSLHIVEPLAAPANAYDVAIGIPARDEATGIAACLAAIDASAAHARPSRVAVVVFVNNSHDATAATARTYAAQHIAVEVIEAELGANEAHAGGARRRALDLALSRLPPDGVLMTTDADSWVDVGWIAANLAEIEAGADAVAGAVTLDSGFDASVAPVRPVRDAEWRLAELQARLHALLDPRPHERWPTHIWAWGASLAVTVHAYGAVGGLPAVSLAEDRAFADALDRHGYRVRRSLAPVVYTSPRRRGRAPGGFADLLASYVDDDQMACDAALEPTATLARRLVWRAVLRQRYAARGAGVCERMTRHLGIDRDHRPPPGLDKFGEWWRWIEDRSPQLRRERVMPAMLPTEIGRAERLIRLIGRAQARRDDNPPCARVARR